MRIQEYVCTKHTVWKVVYEPFNGSVTQKLSQLNESPGHLLLSLPWQPCPGANYELSVRCKKWTYITYIHHLHICNIYIYKYNYLHISVTSSWHQKSTLSDNPRPRTHEATRNHAEPSSAGSGHDGHPVPDFVVNKLQPEILGMFAKLVG
jgi:hypothetical protein